MIKHGQPWLSSHCNNSTFLSTLVCHQCFPAWFYFLLLKLVSTWYFIMYTNFFISSNVSYFYLIILFYFLSTQYMNFLLYTQMNIHLCMCMHIYIYIKHAQSLLYEKSSCQGFTFTVPCTLCI